MTAQTRTMTVADIDKLICDTSTICFFVETKPHKHGVIRRYVTEIDGQYWAFWVVQSEEWGIADCNDGPIELVLVEPREVTQTEWVPAAD